MRMCIPSRTNEGGGAVVCQHFGSAPFFTIYDSLTRSYTTVPNTNAHHAHGNCQPMAIVAQHSIEAVICRGMGSHAIEKLSAHNIKVLKAEPGRVEDVVAAFLAGELKELTPDLACQNHSCH